MTKTLSLLLLALPACSSQTSDGNADSSDSSDTSTQGLTYYAHVKPILDAHCVDCHSEGGIGAFPLSSFEEVEVVRKELTLPGASLPGGPPAGECA